MKFSVPIVLAAAASAASAADSSISGSSSWTFTTTVTNNGMTYTKTGTELYTGQPTTEPTSGTYTFTIMKGDYTKLITNTYGQATTVSTDMLIVGPDETYSRPVSQVVHTTEVSSWLSSHSTENAAALALAEGKPTGSSSGSSSSGSGSSSSGSSSGAAGSLQYGAGVGAVGVAAALLL